MIERFWNSTGKSAAQFLLGILGLALITFAAVRLHLQPGAISLLYLIVVVFVSLRAGFVFSVAVSVVAVVFACITTFFRCSHRQERRTRWPLWQLPLS